MKKGIVLVLAGLMLGGTKDVGPVSPHLMKELEALTTRGYTYRILENNLVEITNPMTGKKQVKSLNQPIEAEIRAWAARRGIPIMEIDPATIDTTQFAQWYRYWTRVPASTSANDFPVIADVDHNGKIENYGVEQDTIFPYTGYMRIYEVDTTGVSALRHTYPPPPFPAIATNITDIDKNGLLEFCIANANLHTMTFFEQASSTQLPTNLRFTYISTNTEAGDPTTTPYFGSLDGDNATDCLHIISEPDSDSLGRTYFKITVAEFDSTINNLRRVWSSPMPPRSDLGFFSHEVTVGDFDNDGRMEFATTTAVVRPTLFIFENDSDNSYHLTFQDTIPNVTNYGAIGSGDIDGDGKPEIFTTATISTGNWTFVHEADSNDHFSIKLIIHILAGGTFDSPLYFVKDMDGDNKPELVFTAGEYLIMLKGNRDNQYEVFFVKRLPWQENMLLSDFNHDGQIDIAIGKYAPLPPATRWVHFTDIWLRDRTVGIGEAKVLGAPSLVLSSYPNPFNACTTIEYVLPTEGHIQLLLYDAAGRLIRTLVDKMQTSGAHSFFLDGREMSSAVYFCQLRTSASTITRKILLLR